MQPTRLEGIKKIFFEIVVKAFILIIYSTENMDNLQLHNEVAALKNLREEYEDQLKTFRLELSDLPDDLSALLDECIELQMTTKLHDLSENYLQEFYFMQKKEAIENMHTTAKLKAEIKQLQEMLDKETEEQIKLEKFTTNLNKRIVSEAEMVRNKLMIENNMKGLQERMKDLQIPEDLNIDELIKKVDLLKNKNKSKEK